MGTVFRKQTTRALPAGAEIVTKGRIGERVARWKRNGKTREALATVGTDGAERIVTESRTCFAKYRDGDGIVHTVATGCRDEQAARQRLAELMKAAERVRAGIMTPVEERIAGLQRTDLADHFDSYLTSLEAAEVTAGHRANVRRFLDRLAGDCGWTRLADLNRAIVEGWLAIRSAEGMGARTRNAYRDSAVAFGNWAKLHQRLAANPFAGLPKANVKADPRRQRRALTEDELMQLLDATARRPVVDASTVRRGADKGKQIADLRPETIERLELLGRERALIVKTLVLTGLRKGELASLTVGQLHLDVSPAFAMLAAADEKNREGSDVPIRDDLATDLRDWLADRLQRLQEAARDGGERIPARLPASTPLFSIPAGFLRILNRDLKAAGIAKRDDRGRVVVCGGVKVQRGAEEK